MSPRTMWSTVAFALAFVIALFFVSPLLFMNWLDRYLESSLASNLIEGIMEYLTSALKKVSAVSQMVSSLVRPD